MPEDTIYEAEEILGAPLEAYDEILGAEEDEVYEILGANGYSEDEIDDILGKRRGRRSRRSRRSRFRPSRGGRGGGRLSRAMSTMRDIRSMQRAQIAKRPSLIPGIEGAHEVSLKQLPAPFTSVTFDATTPGPHILVCEPQNLMRGSRLVTISSPNADAVTQGVALLITALKVGSSDQIISAGNIPFDTFGPTAQDVGLRLDGGSPGIKIYLYVSASPTPAGTSSVGAAATLIGQCVK